MSKLGNFIKKRRDELRLSLRDFEKFGITGQAIHKIENDMLKNPPTLKTLEAIAGCLKVEFSFIHNLAMENLSTTDDSNLNNSYTNSFLSLNQIRTVELPYYSVGVPCDDNNILYSSAVEKIVLPMEFAKEIDFIIRANGNSMSCSYIKDGSKLLVKYQSHIDNNEDIMIIDIKDYGILCRHVFYNNNTKKYHLKPANLEYSEIATDPNMCQIIGKVVRIITDLN